MIGGLIILPASVLLLNIIYASIISNKAPVFLVLNLRANSSPRLEKALRMSHSPEVRKCVCV